MKFESKRSGWISASWGQKTGFRNSTKKHFLRGYA